MQYVPDCWKIIEINFPGEKAIRKLLAGWYGGYTSGQSWQLNSGISSVEETDQYYNFVGYSGSVYTCYKNREGINSIMSDMLRYWNEEASVKGASIKAIEFKNDE